ncbi:MAG: hypothetical protein IPK25_17410 [Saprospiraceae bacterium]|nr:hypothetical protein [Saprospiraceae bacterium]
MVVRGIIAMAINANNFEKNPSKRQKTITVYGEDIEAILGKNHISD